VSVLPIRYRSTRIKCSARLLQCVKLLIVGLYSVAYITYITVMMTEVRMHVWTCNHYLYTTRLTSIHTILLLLIPLQPILLQRVVVHMSRDDRGTDAVHAYAHIKSRPEDALPKMKGCSLVPCFPDPGSCRPKRLCHARNYYNPARSAQYSSHSRSQLFAHSRPLLRAPSRSRCAWDSGTET